MACEVAACIADLDLLCVMQRCRVSDKGRHEVAIKKLDDTEFCGSYVCVAPKGDSSRRARSRSPTRGRSPGHCLHSRAPAARKESPRRSRSKSASLAAAVAAFASPVRKTAA